MMNLHTAFQRWYTDLGHCREEKLAARHTPKKWMVSKPITLDIA